MVEKVTRRQALVLAVGQSAASRPRRLAPREQLVNVLEYEAQARLTLDADAAVDLADGDRSEFDRITLRPRMLVPTLDLDLSVTLLGDRLVAPILVAPIANQKRFHPDGERATVKGASAAGAAVIVSNSSPVSIGTLVAESATPIWCQVHAADPAAPRQIASAVEAGCKAICLSVGITPFANGTRPRPARIDWKIIDALTRDNRLPIVVKGISTPDAAAAALRHNVHALIVSNYGGAAGPVKEPLLFTLPAIVKAVAGRVPVVVDGSFRRGTDILKALAFGATAVAVGRPVMWGLAAYGADGVQGVIEMLQTELARYMAMCGRSTISKLDGTVLQVHGVPSTRSASND
jgi:4-hydroxymandelate oxidase